MQLAEREKNIALEINFVSSEVSGILARIVQYDVVNSRIRIVTRILWNYLKRKFESQFKFIAINIPKKERMGYGV